MQTCSLSARDPRSQAVLTYIKQYWRKLVRYNPEDSQTLIGLPHPYLVPSDGEMFQEMYYWDNFFMSLGLVGTDQEHLITDMTLNMAHLFKRFGLIPNASRYYFLSRSQPPFFTQMIWLAFSVLQARSDENAHHFLQEMIMLAEEEHDRVWLGKHQPHRRLMDHGLSRYFDINFIDALASCESGWDHSTRCEDRWMEHLPIDLNTILYVREIDIAKAWMELANVGRAQQWTERAERRKEAINNLMWDERVGFYFDYDLKHQRVNSTATLAGFFPLWAGIATDAQAHRIVEDWLPRFEHCGGLVTSLASQHGRQWAFPNGWAPLQWLVTEGLDRYGFKVEATRIREKWCGICNDIFEKSGTMWEKYNVVDPHQFPEDGLYGSISGFGWTNAVYVDFHRKLSEAAPEAESIAAFAASPVASGPLLL